MRRQRNIMPNIQYRLNPMQKTLSIPVHWEFSKNDYDKLVEGHRSNWCVFLHDGVVHFCRVSGEEFYRFALSEVDNGIYVTDNWQVYATDNFYEVARRRGWSEGKIEQDYIRFIEAASNEVTGLLEAYFGIRVSR